MKLLREKARALFLSKQRCAWHCVFLFRSSYTQDKECAKVACEHVFAQASTLFDSIYSPTHTRRRRFLLSCLFAEIFRAGNLMNSFFTLIASNPILAVITPIIAISIPLMCLLAYAGLGFMTGVLQIQGVRSQRSAYDKCARQIASLAMVLGWLLLIGIRIWIFVNAENYNTQSFIWTSIEMSWDILGIAVIGTSIHFAVWKTLAKHRILHALMAFLFSINATGAVLMGLGTLRLLAALKLPNASSLSLLDLFNFPLFPSPLWNTCLLVLPLCFAMPGAMAMIWLVIRRNRDDYGRDYYKIMLPWCASWGLRAWLVTTLVLFVCIGLNIRAMLTSNTFTFTPQEIMLHAVQIVPPLLALLIMFLVRRAEFPLRYKPAIYLLFLLCAPSAYFLFKHATTFVFS